MQTTNWFPNVLNVAISMDSKAKSSDSLGHHLCMFTTYTLIRTQMYSKPKQERVRR
jgi:hypothetical protein